MEVFVRLPDDLRKIIVGKMEEGFGEEEERLDARIAEIEDEFFTICSGRLIYRGIVRGLFRDFRDLVDKLGLHCKIAVSRRNRFAKDVVLGWFGLTSESEGAWIFEQLNNNGFYFHWNKYVICNELFNPHAGSTAGACWGQPNVYIKKNVCFVADRFKDRLKTKKRDDMIGGLVYLEMIARRGVAEFRNNDVL